MQYHIIYFSFFFHQLRINVGSIHGKSDAKSYPFYKAWASKLCHAEENPQTQEKVVLGLNVPLTC
jgi:hypothetical protein